MRARYLIIYIMAMVYINPSLVHFIKVIGNKVNMMVMELVLINMETSILESLKKIKNMGKDYKFMRMEKNIKGLSIKMQRMDLENITIRMEISMKGNGQITFVGEKVNKYILMALIIRGIGLKMISMEEES